MLGGSPASGLAGRPSTAEPNTDQAQSLQSSYAEKLPHLGPPAVHCMAQTQCLILLRLLIERMKPFDCYESGIEGM